MENQKISMVRKWKSILNKINKIEGLLIPGQEKALYALASSLSEGATIVEIGCFKGKSTACLAFGCPKNAHIFAIDTFEGNKEDFLKGVQFSGGNFFNQFVRNIKKLRLSSKITPLRGFSEDIGKEWKRSIDLLFIDGSHVYEDVKKDFELFFPWVKPGGVVAFHDVTPEFPGVYRVWNDIAKKKLSTWRNITTLYFGFKPKSVFSKITDRKRIKLLLRKM